MAVTQYVGARYVPLFANPLEWDSKKPYEPLTIVYHEGNSYTSRQFVPTGIDIGNETYWALTGNYNAQIEQYRMEVAKLATEVESLKFVVDNPNMTIRVTNEVIASNSIYLGVKFTSKVDVSNLENIIFLGCTFSVNHANALVVSNASNIAVLQCNFNSTAAFSTNYYHIYGICNASGSNKVTSEFLASAKSNITIYGCKFSFIAHSISRSIVLINYRNVVVDNCSFATDEYSKDMSDDLITFDLCENVRASNLMFGNSGENIIDILSCKNAHVENVVFGTAEYTPISIDVSDVAKTFGSDIDVTNINIYVDNVSGKSCRSSILVGYANDVYAGNINANPTNYLWEFITNYVDTVQYEKLDNIQFGYFGGNPASSFNVIPKVFKKWGSLKLNETPFKIELTPVLNKKDNVVSVGAPLENVDIYAVYNDVEYPITGFTGDRGAFIAGKNTNIETAFNYNIIFGQYVQLNDTTLSYSIPAGTTIDKVNLYFR